MKQVESSESQREVFTAAVEEEEIQFSTLKLAIKSPFRKLCKHSGKESLQSWMSVRVTVSSPVSSLVMLIVGPFIGIILILLLVLLWRYRRSKDLSCI
ncbi:hypothetical protein AMECASPLE_039530, partial [Ameca splendens]